MKEQINHPDHYNNHPSGVECLDIVRHMSFNLGNSVKYIWRADLKDCAIQDLKKAVFYLQDEITLRENTRRNNMPHLEREDTKPKPIKKKPVKKKKKKKTIRSK